MKRAFAAAAATAAALALSAGPALADNHEKINTNSDKAWSKILGVECTKAEYGGDMKYITADKAYDYVLVKGGNEDVGYGPGIMLYEGVWAGEILKAPLNGGGQQAGVSWVMTCGEGYEPPPSYS